MIDSTGIPVGKGFKAERPKSTVLKQPSTERPRCTPTSTLSAPSFIARRTISCLRSPEMPAPGHRRRDRHALRRPGDHGHPLRPPLPRVAAKRLSPPLPRAAPAARLLQAPGPPGRDDRVAHRRLRRPEPRLPRRPAADRLDSGRVRPLGRDDARARLWPTPPTTATAPPTRASSGAFACTACSLPTAPPGPSPSPLPSATSARSGSSCSNARNRVGGEILDRRQGLRRARASPPRSASSTPRSCARRARTSPAAASTSRRSASGSSRSSGPARTSSPWSATAPAPCTTCAFASPCASWPGRMHRLNHRLGRPSRALVDYVA